MLISLSENSSDVSIKSIRDFIVKNYLGENDTIILNSLNYDDIVLGFREEYKNSLPIPFYFLRVLVRESDSIEKVRLNEIKIIRNDSLRFFEDYLPNSKKEIKFTDLEYSDKIIYICGWCGNVVDNDGAELSGEIRRNKIGILEMFNDQVVQEKVNGKCCLNNVSSS